MKVTLATQGGLTAGIRRTPRSVNSAALPADGAAEMARLVAELEAAPAAQESHPGRARDAMTVTLTIEDDSGASKDFSQTDTAMSPAFGRLVQWLERHLKAK